MGDRVVAPALSIERFAQAEFGLAVGGGASQRVAPQCLVVAPKRRLPDGTSHENDNCQPRAGPQRQAPFERTGGQPRGPPGQRDVEPDAGQIHVTIGHRMRGDRDQSQHRGQHAQVPEAADKEIRTLASPEDRGRAGRAQDRDCGGHFPGGRTAERIGIVDGQIDGIEKLDDIGDARNRRGADPLRPGQRHACPDMGHRASSDNRPPPGQTEAAFPAPAAVGQAARSTASRVVRRWPSRIGPMARNPSSSQQRRQRDEHRLGHQAERKSAATSR